MRDSAGIAIVENGAPASAPLWATKPTPELDLGGADADLASQFSGIASVGFLPDGRVFVADRGSRSIRTFHWGGELLASFGRAGEGPGEFAFIWRAWPLRGDTLLVLDPQLQRLTRFLAHDGTVLGVSPLDPPFQHSAGDEGVFADGSIFLSATPAHLPATGAVEGRVAYVRYGNDGALLDTLGRGGPRSVAAAAGSVYVTGGAGRAEFLVHDMSGRLIRIVRWDPGDLTVIPVYAGLLVDRTGRVWAEPYHRPEAVPSNRWLVFDLAGRLAARVELPLSFRPHDVMEDRMLGVEWDELGVEHVRVYRIETARAQ